MRSTRKYVLHENFYVYSIYLGKVFPRNTRESNRIVFKTDGYEGSLYKRSPYFVGAKLWDRLSPEIIGLPNIFVFKNALRHMNKNYLDLLS